MNTCRFCLKYPENIQLNKLSRKYVSYIELILPEIDLNLTKKPQICSSCINSLEDAYYFKKTCLESEEQLKNVENTKIKREVVTDFPETKKNYIELDNEEENIIVNIIPENTKFSTDFEPEQEIENNISIKNEIEIGENEIICLENTTNSPNNINKHKEKYKCKICEKKFHKNTPLQIHEAFHLNLRKYVCNICGKGFVVPAGLKLHMTVHEKNKIKRYQCKDCDKQFVWESSLRHHKTVHLKKEQNCEICGKLFYKATDLKTHMNTHKKIKPYQCHQCGRTFVAKVNVAKHIRNHCHGEISLAPFQCNVCDKKYIKSSSFEAHKLSHIDGNRKHCKICGKTFFYTDILKRHLKLHDDTSLKPFQCNGCGKRFDRKPYLQKHVRLHCPGKKL